MIAIPAKILIVPKGIFDFEEPIFVGDGGAAEVVSVEKR